MLRALISTYSNTILEKKAVSSEDSIRFFSLCPFHSFLLIAFNLPFYKFQCLVLSPYFYPYVLAFPINFFNFSYFLSRNTWDMDRGEKDGSFVLYWESRKVNEQIFKLHHTRDFQILIKVKHHTLTLFLKEKNLYEVWNLNLRKQFQFQGKGNIGR